MASSSLACASYSSIQKSGNEIYLSGATNYFVVSVPFLKRCDVDGQVLRCEELKEFEPPPAPRRSGDAGADAPPEAPAPEKKAGAK